MITGVDAGCSISMKNQVENPFRDSSEVGDRPSKWDPMIEEPHCIASITWSRWTVYSLHFTSPPPTMSSTIARMTIFSRAIGEKSPRFYVPSKTWNALKANETFFIGCQLFFKHKSWIFTWQPVFNHQKASSLISNTSSDLVPPPSPSHASTSLSTPAWFITRNFMVIANGTQCTSIGVPTITHWPSNTRNVVVTLSYSKKTGMCKLS